MPDHMVLTKLLTRAEYDDVIAGTFLGQAHLAGTGPEGKTCRQCIFWHQWEDFDNRIGPISPGYYSEDNEDHPLELHRARCNFEIANKADRLVPHYAKACRLFKEAPSPFPEKKPAKESCE